MQESRDYTKQAHEMLARVKQILGETEGWAVKKSKDGIVVEAKQYEGSSINCYRIKGEIDRDGKRCVDELFGWGLEQWKVVSSDLQEMKEIETVNDDVHVVYQTSKMPWPLTDRDWVSLDVRAEDGGAHFYLNQSTTHDKCPADSKYIRLNNIISGICFIPKSNGKTELARIVHVDPSGSIPTAIINSISKTMLTGTVKIRDTLSA